MDEWSNKGTHERTNDEIELTTIGWNNKHPTSCKYLPLYIYLRISIQRELYLDDTWRHRNLRKWRILPTCRRPEESFELVRSDSDLSIVHSPGGVLAIEQPGDFLFRDLQGDWKFNSLSNWKVAVEKTFAHTFYHPNDNNIQTSQQKHLLTN